MARGTSSRLVIDARRACSRLRPPAPRVLATGCGLALVVLLSWTPATAAEAASGRAQAGSAAAIAAAAPSIVLQAQGVNDPNWTPSDSNGAIGTSRFIETVNNQVGIYSTALAPISQFPLFDLDNVTSGYVTDPEVLWDPGTKRFYYSSMYQNTTTGQWSIALGYSKTPKPNGATDFCHYFIAIGANEPDFPKIGGTKDFVLVGVNYYAPNGSYAGAADLWMAKPGSASLTSCPIAPATGHSGNLQFTPVPARQIDPSSTGYILSSVWSGGTTVTEYKVTKSATGTPVFSAGKTITVASYSTPASPPQAGATQHLFSRTNDNRLTEVTEAIDPRLGKPVLWTDHTIFGGPGDAVRWYEIDPAATTVAQTGTIADSHLYVFNGTISPDRVYKSSTAKGFGSNMIVGFNTSSSTTDSAIRMVSKIGLNPVSAMKLVVLSPGPNIDYSCPNATDTCRWGDYSGANPDPNAALTGSSGRVWLTNMWNQQSTSTFQSNWLTENWEATP